MNRKLIGIITIVMMAYALPAFAAIINIPADYLTIQEGINSSADGDTVLVQPGTYVENINFNGHNITLGSLFLTTGDTAYIAETVIDGNSSGSVVTFENGEDSTTVIAGFTIMNGYSNFGGGICARNATSPTIIYNDIRSNTIEGDPFDFNVNGCGIYATGASLISNNIIRDNTVTLQTPAYSVGGGIYIIGPAVVIQNEIHSNYARGGGGIGLMLHAQALIMNNNISGNEAFEAGGLYCNRTEATIFGNSVNNNSAQYEVGGIYCYRGSNRFNSNEIVGNSSEHGAGGISVIGDSSVFVNNYIAQNNAGSRGGGVKLSNFGSTFEGNFIIGNLGYGTGGVFCVQSDELQLTNNVILNNSSEYYGGICFDNVSAVLINNIVRGNENMQLFNWESELTVAYCNIQDSLWPGEGNIDTDPLFRDPENGDFHLMSTACGDPYDSPCIDTGSPALIDSLLDCDWGLGTILSDMGAYGGGDSATVDISDYLDRFPSRFSFLQNYPNPFNPTTIIRYSLRHQSDVTIEIYNILGQRVATLFDGNKQAGYHTIAWHADDYPSGVYFARLEAGIRAENIKMVLLK